MHNQNNLGFARITDIEKVALKKITQPKMKKQKGFTLVELLVVIAIVAVLSVVVILTLNPAELLKQARDSNRISDMATLKSAIALYLADGQDITAAKAGGVVYGNCWLSVTTTSACTGHTFATGAFGTATGSAATTVAGSGWLPINFNAISSGAPIGSLPLDPSNGHVYYYGFGATSTNTSFKLVSKLFESTKYTSGVNNVPGTDGGSSATAYEVGTLLTL